MKYSKFSPVAQLVERVAVRGPMKSGRASRAEGEGSFKRSFHGKPWLTKREDSGKPKRKAVGNPEPSPARYLCGAEEGAETMHPLS
ncbi:hypothetical protein ACFL38_01440 [Candidatus Omnitrophota bacterium]